MTVRFTAAGHPLRGAECRAAAIVTGCSGMYTITGCRFSDAERERLPAGYSGPEIRPATIACHCGNVPDGVDQAGMHLYCQLNPAQPDSRGEYDGIPGGRRISSAFMGPAEMVCW